ncbi:MAG: polyamine ABC transporter substrate-binding protein [Alphaproteobacteria bacterium]|nr:polyamine ABC transporter substrate-binding protein [Alphaproteobacteria bacterium]
MTRAFLPLASAVGLALLAGSAWSQGKVVNVYNWTDYIAEDAPKAFQDATGIKVNYTTYDTNEILDAKLKTGKSGYDVVTPTMSPHFARQKAAGLFRKIDKAQLKNYGNLDPEIMKALARYDPGNEYGVPWMWGTTGIGFNVEAAKKRLGDAPVDSLKLIFDPATVAKFKDCGVMMLDSPTDVLPAALLYLGLDPDSKKVDDLEKAADVVRKVRPSIRKFTSAEMINALARGDICLAFTFSGDVLQARDRGAKAKPTAVEVNYAIPREGSQLWIDVMAIPRDAVHVAEAHRWIDYLLDPKVAAASSDTVGYASGNKAAVPLMKTDVSGDPLIYPPEPVRAKFFTISPGDPDHVRLRTRLWTNIKTGR